MERAYNVKVDAQGLLAEDVEVLLHGFDCLFCVNGGSSTDDNGLQTGVLDHVLVLGVQGHTVRLKVLLRPLNLLWVRRECSDQLRAGRAVEEVDGMAFAHAAEASSAHLELLGRHDTRQLRQKIIAL